MKEEKKNEELWKDELVTPYMGLFKREEPELEKILHLPDEMSPTLTMILKEINPDYDERFNNYLMHNLCSSIYLGSIIEEYERIASDDIAKDMDHIKNYIISMCNSDVKHVIVPYSELYEAIKLNNYNYNYSLGVKIVLVMNKLINDVLNTFREEKRIINIILINGICKRVVTEVQGLYLGTHETVSGINSTLMYKSDIILRFDTAAPDTMVGTIVKHRTMEILKDPIVLDLRKGERDGK